MIIYLTSDFGMSKKIDRKRIACKGDNSNQIFSQLKNDIKKFDSLVCVASSPQNAESNDMHSNNILEGLKLSGLSFKNLTVLDDRLKGQNSNIEKIVKNADLVFLMGGPVPSQNDFFKEINLKNVLSNFGGVIIGQSAGAMNLAKEVYNYPEDESELNGARNLHGLALTDINIVPHFEMNKGNVQVDKSIDLMNDYLLPDSYKKELIGQMNLSHIRIENKNATVYGETYLIKNGKISKICKNGEVYNLNNKKITKR